MMEHNGVKIAIVLVLLGASLAGIAGSATATTCVLLGEDVEDTVNGVRCVVNDTQCLVLGDKCVPV